MPWRERGEISPRRREPWGYSQLPAPADPKSGFAGRAAIGARCTPRRQGHRPEALRDVQAQQFRGVQIGSFPTYGDVQVGAGGAARASAQTQFLAAGDFFAFLHSNLRKMHIEGEQALPVVEDNTVSLEVERARQQHRSAVHGHHRGSGGHGVVESLVAALDLAVEGAAGAEHVRHWRRNRRMEVSTPQAIRIEMLEGVLFDDLVLVDFLQLLRVWFGELLRNRDGNARIARPGDGELAFKGKLVSPRGRGGKREGILARSGLQAYAGQTVPGFRRRIEGEIKVMTQPGSGEGF